MAICKQCNKEYDAKTARSQYCSHTCRALANKAVAQPGFAQPQQPVVAQPAVAQPVTLSDGQQWTPDPEPQRIIESWFAGEGTPYQQQLATLSLQYDILKGSDKARARAKQLLQPHGAWSC